MSEVPAIDALQTDCEDVIERIRGAVVTDREPVETLLVGVLAKGHVLVEDVPGTGKTLLARSLATALGLSFNRIQFTPDLLPADVTGSNVYREDSGQFEFVPGPVFDNVVLADELNRAPPKTQAALLEAMEEGQVSVDGETHALPDPFIVIATQNPVEQEGTFALPEAQRDRFMLRTALGYPSFEGERTLLDNRAERETPTPTVDRVVTADRVRAMQLVPETIHVAPAIRDFIVELARATRNDGRVELGVSPRGIQRLFEASRARAGIAGRDYVVPDDVIAVAEATLAHRLVLTTEATVEGLTPADIVEQVRSRVSVPAVEDIDPATPSVGDATASNPTVDDAPADE
jgi:MoxR-like ATPase